jgi:hypothetical protein
MVIAFTTITTQVEYPGKIIELLQITDKLYCIHLAMGEA